MNPPRLNPLLALAYSNRAVAYTLLSMDAEPPLYFNGWL